MSAFPQNHTPQLLEPEAQALNSKDRPPPPPPHCDAPQHGPDLLAWISPGGGGVSEIAVKT